MAFSFPACKTENYSDSAVCKGTPKRRSEAQAPGLHRGLVEAEITKEGKPKAGSPALAQSAGKPNLLAAQQPRARRVKERRHRRKLEKERASHYAAAPIKTENSALLGVSPRPCQEGAGSEKPQLHFFPYSGGMSFKDAFPLSQQNHLFIFFPPSPAASSCLFPSLFLPHPLFWVTTDLECCHYLVKSSQSLWLSECSGLEVPAHYVCELTLSLTSLSSKMKINVGTRKQRKKN